LIECRQTETPYPKDLKAQPAFSRAQTFSAIHVMPRILSMHTRTKAQVPASRLPSFHFQTRTETVAGRFSALKREKPTPFRRFRLA
jgi:hypothetical protein